MYKKNIHALILSATLSVIALFLSFFSFAIPFLPPFLQLDFAFIPLFFGLIVIGRKNAIIISLLKNLLHFLLISHEPVGSIANICVEVIFLLCMSYFLNKSKKQIIFGGILATILITLFMSLLNYFIFLPAYGYIMNLSDIVNNVKVIVAVGIVPFNIIKGIMLIFLFFFTESLIKKIPKRFLVMYSK